MMNAQKFTQKSMEAVQSAQDIALSRSGMRIEQCHLLLALLTQEQGLIPQLLARLPVDVPAFTREAERLVVIHQGTIPFSGPPEAVFAHGDELEAMGLGVPAMTKVFARLRSMGVDLPASVYTIPQAQEAILAALHRKEGR